MVSSRGNMPLLSLRMVSSEHLAGVEESRKSQNKKMATNHQKDQSAQMVGLVEKADIHIYFCIVFNPSNGTKPRAIDWGVIDLPLLGHLSMDTSIRATPWEMSESRRPSWQFCHAASVCPCDGSCLEAPNVLGRWFPCQPTQAN